MTWEAPERAVTWGSGGLGFVVTGVMTRGGER